MNSTGSSSQTTFILLHLTVKNLFFCEEDRRQTWPGMCMEATVEKCSNDKKSVRGWWKRPQRFDSGNGRLVCATLTNQDLPASFLRTSAYWAFWSTVQSYYARTFSTTADRKSFGRSIWKRCNAKYSGHQSIHYCIRGALEGAYV